jgi:caa(3)-type oxidase subunit IV
MTQQSTQALPDHGHAEPNYVKIWAILVALLVVSVLGPMLGHPIITIITAFGIAIVKASLVVRHFMHVHLEPRYISYLFASCLAFVLLFFAGTAPDVMRHEGTNWVNVAAIQEVERATASAAAPSGAPAAPLTPEVAFNQICAACHGAAGNGQGPAAAALDPHPADFTSVTFWETRDAAHVARVIREGGAAVGRSPLMPSFGAQFDEEAAAALAEYVVATFRPAGAGLPAADGGVEAGAVPSDEAPAETL